MNSINERMLILMAYYGLNINSFSKRIGMKNNSIIGKLVHSKTRRPSYETIMKILEAFPKVCCEWFVTGRGEMFGDMEDNISDPEDRVAYLMRKFGFSIKDFSNKINVPESEINNIINKSQQPSIRLLSTIASEFPQVDPKWLFTNEGKFFRGEGG